MVELDDIKENKMKEKTIKEYKRRLWLLLESKLNGKNKLTAINAWAVVYSDTAQEYYSGNRVNWNMWTGNQGK